MERSHGEEEATLTGALMLKTEEKSSHSSILTELSPQPVCQRNEARAAGEPPC